VVIATVKGDVGEKDGDVVVDGRAFVSYEKLAVSPLLAPLAELIRVRTSRHARVAWVFCRHLNAVDLIVQEGLGYQVHPWHADRVGEQVPVV
jgi:hypothetical protein